MLKHLKEAKRIAEGMGAKGVDVERMNGGHYMLKGQLEGRTFRVVMSGTERLRTLDNVKTYIRRSVSQAPKS